MFQDFAALMDLRNELVHMKGLSESHVRDQQPEFHQPKALNRLNAKKLVSQRPGDICWTDIIRTPECALWACDAAATIVVNIIDDFPSDGDYWPRIKKSYEDPFLTHLERRYQTGPLNRLRRKIPVDTAQIIEALEAERDGAEPPHRTHC